MKIKTIIISYWFSLTRVVKIKKTPKTNVGENMEQLELSYFVGSSIKSLRHYENSWAFSLNLAPEKWKCLQASEIFTSSFFFLTRIISKLWLNIMSYGLINLLVQIQEDIVSGLNFIKVYFFIRLGISTPKVLVDN